MSIKAVLFDLDGTLLDTLPDLHNITNITLRQLNYPERSIEEVRMFVGFGMRKLIGRALPEGVEMTEEIYERMHRNYLENQNRLSVKYEGIDEMLSTLRAHGIKCAIVSNKPDAAAQEVQKLYFPEMDFTTGQREDMHTKPHRDLSDLAMRTLGVTSAECVYVGDSDTDIETGTNAGMETLACAWGFRGEEFLLSHGAKHLLHSVPEITEYVLSH